MSFYLGCAVWSYPGWVGNFYPPKTAAKHFLTLYSERLTAVEGNTTFYAIPDNKTIIRWREQTPSGFKFCLKFPQTVTHQGRLLNKVEQGIEFIQQVKPLGDRLGPLLLQLPPNYSPNYLDDLSEFLTILFQENLPLSVEVRHPDWFTIEGEKTLNHILKKQGIGRVILDSRPIYQKNSSEIIQSRRKPNLPLHLNVTSNFILIRFISHPQFSDNIDYLHNWVKQVDEWLKKEIDIYFFVHCPIEEESPFIARNFQTMLENHQVNIPVLPWEQVTFVQQLSLFPDNS